MLHNQSTSSRHKVVQLVFARQVTTSSSFNTVFSARLSNNFLTDLCNELLNNISNYSCVPNFETCMEFMRRVRVAAKPKRHLADWPITAALAPILLLLVRHWTQGMCTINGWR